jgi:hypothetical protein
MIWSKDEGAFFEKNVPNYPSEPNLPVFEQSLWDDNGSLVLSV